jgi:hypothetical protein
MDPRTATEGANTDDGRRAGSTRCAFCARPALESIPSNTGRVCPAHALEFWTELIAYATNRPDNASLAR